MSSSHTPIPPRPSGFIDPSARGLRRIEHVMGMPVVFEVCDAGVGPEPVQDAIDWLHWVDATFSTYRSDSEISRFNRGELPAARLHPDVLAILDRCAELKEATDGFFDIAAPFREGAVDPSGLVKGWAVAAAADRLTAAGARNFAVNAGGDIVARGRPAGEDAWRIGIQHPRRSRAIAITLAISDGAVATSGAYIRGQHIVDPHTGRAPAGLLSVTITGPDLPTADAYATAVFAMGAERGAAWCGRLSGYDAVLICDDDTVLRTPGVQVCT